MNNLLNPFNNKDLEPKQLFEKLVNYYNNNSLYGDMKTYEFMEKKDLDIIKGLLTPVNRSVEFFTNKIIPGDLKNVSISTDNENVKEAIQQVWKWSNFAAKKQLAVRQLALFGNLLWKALTSAYMTNE